MAVTKHTWITVWFLLTAPVILWDASYCFFRPRSMVGGDLHWIWKPYSIYQEVDYIYGVEAYKRGDGFPNAQSFLNVIETAMNLAYVFLVYLTAWPGAPMIGFAAATATLAKTILYWAVEYFCGGCSTGHNSLPDLILYFIIPNVLWILVPGGIVIELGRDIAASLQVAAAKTETKKNE